MSEKVTAPREKKGWMWFFLSVLVCVAAAAFCIRLFYGDRFPTGSRLGGLLCGGMKTEDVSLLLAETVEKKTVILSGGEGEEICTLPLSEAVGTADYAVLAAAALKSSSGPDYPLSFAVESETLLPLLEERLFGGDYVEQQPRDAEIVLDEDGAHIVPEEPGNLYLPEAFAAALSQALSAGVDLSGDAIRVTVPNERTMPALLSDDPLLRKQLADIRRWTDKSVDIFFLPGLEHTLTPGEIAAMLDIDCHDRGADVAVNEEKFRAEMDRLIEELGADGPMAKYGRCAGTRQYLYLPAEDTGFPLDREALYEAVLAALRGEGGSVEAGYDYTAWLRARYGWMGDLHDCLEISIDNQYIWFYRNGLLLTECPVVTGDLATNSITRKGIFQIYGMVTDTNLKGPTCDDHVDYWMPFDGDIGIHDSSWRDEYGGDIYRENGSHGCVNTPLESMGIIYDNSFYGLLVIVR